MTSRSHSYDLFERRHGWSAKSALVLSPYVQEQFFNRIARDLCPEQLCVVIDDGCRREDLEMVRTAVAKCDAKCRPVLTCTLGSAAGLVHIKLIYIEWRTPRNRVAHTIIYGSANATRQGFSGNINAELIAICHLTQARNKPIIVWCQSVIAAVLRKRKTVIRPQRDVELGKGMHIRLPGLTVGRDVPSLNNFDLWIQRGYLLSEYRPDPGFLRVPIQLERGLALAEQAKIAANFGFAVPQTRRLNYLYVSSTEAVAQDIAVGDEEGIEEAENGNWRRQLFVWTQLGDWCSEACHDKHRKQFKRCGIEMREKQLKSLEELRSGVKLKAARELFVVALSKLWKAYGADAPKLFRGKSTVDIDFYQKIFDDRVTRDLEFASDEEFKVRYIGGYELVQVPRFRNDVAGWRDFVNSLARQLCLDATRSRSQSKLLHAVKKALGDDQAALEQPKLLLEAFRETWAREDSEQATKAARIVSSYYLR